MTARAPAGPSRTLAPGLALVLALGPALGPGPGFGPIATPLLGLALSPAAAAGAVKPGARPPAPARPARPVESSETDVWPEHALPDGDAARQGRSALPFTRKQIETLGRLLRQTQRATARGAGAPPKGRIRRIRLDGPGDGRIPAIALRRGYTTVLAFTGMTGAPWPIAEAVLDSRFLPPGQEAAPQGASGGPSHLLYLAPRQAYLDGNAVVTLAGLAEPLVIALRGTGATADFRVDIRLARPGPNADPSALARPEGFHAGDPVLLGLLGGAVPPDAERLAVEGGGPDGRAWRQGGDLLLVMRAHLLSPGPWAAERGPGGRWAYRLPDTPRALVSANGRETRLSFRAIEITIAPTETRNE